MRILHYSLQELIVACIDCKLLFTIMLQFDILDKCHRDSCKLTPWSRVQYDLDIRLETKVFVVDFDF